MDKKITQCIIGISLILVLYVPFDGIIDRNATQWLLLSLINFVALAYNLFIIIKGNLKDFKTPFSFKVFVALFFWAFISITYTISFQVTVIDLSRLFLYMISYLNLLIVFKEINIPFKKLGFVFLIMLVYEMYYCYESLFQIMSEGPFFREGITNLIKGVTSNKNITSFSIALKVPFLIYLFFRSNKNYFKIIILFLIVLAYVILFYLDTRAITLSNYIVLFTIFIFGVLNKDVKKRVQLITVFSTIFISFNIPPYFNNEVSPNEVLLSSMNNDNSSNQRLRYYKAGMSQILSNPLIGVGLGSWKLESINYDKQFTKQYIVPYHMHNDFLQFGAELGVIGMLLYFLFFSSSLFNYLVKKTKRVIDTSSLSLLIFFIYFFVDSNLNFPFARPMIFIQLLLVIAYIENKSIRTF